MRRFIIIIFFTIIINTLCHAARIKDISVMQGIRGNQLIGYGLVVGLDGTGDATNQAIFTAQSFKSMLNRFGIRIPPGVNLQTKNIAAVMVTADLPAFSKPGRYIDVTVSSIGNAKSLRGGTLLLTSLKGADNNIYAMAQGSLVVSGLAAEGADGSKVTVNVPSVGRIPNGGTVEKPAPTVFGLQDAVIFNLHRADFTSATRMAKVINSQLSRQIAKPLDASSIRVSLPSDPTQRVQLLSRIENLTFNPGESAAKIVINSRTGTVVIGKHVSVTPAAVSHGSLVVTISETPTVSQPLPESLGQTTVVQQSQVQITDEENRAFVFKPGPTLEDIVRAVNSVGASPSDLVAILDALKSSGSLSADVEVI